MSDALDTIYKTILQRPPTNTERTFAKKFVQRRETDPNSKSMQQISEFITLLLCGNEFLYID